MVAISLYRGNLHKPPDTPRKWVMPPHKLSLKDFKTLLNRRNKAIQSLRAKQNDQTAPDRKTDGVGVSEVEKGKQVEGFDGFSSGLRDDVRPGELVGSDDMRVEILGDPVVEKGCDGSGSSKGPSDLAAAVVTEKRSHGSEGLKELKVEIPSEGVNSDAAEKSNKVEPSNEKEKRKKEIEEELKVLTERKHSLVQALKQILNVEEELKRRNTMQGSAARPPSQLKIEVPNDSGLMTHHTVTKLGSEANNAGVAGGTEGHDTSNQNVHSRHLLRASSASPSFDSLRKPAFSQHNVVPHPSRSSLGVSESPSRFAPTPTGQGHSTNLPAVSASGTNYIASSPSPAASGGTSVFRDSRFPSPWN